MIKMRKMLAVIMVIVLIVSTISVGASASDESFDSIACEGTTVEHDHNEATKSCLVDEKAGAEEEIESSNSVTYTEDDAVTFEGSATNKEIPSADSNTRSSIEEENANTNEDPASADQNKVSTESKEEPIAESADVEPEEAGLINECVDGQIGSTAASIDGAGESLDIALSEEAESLESSSTGDGQTWPDADGPLSDICQVLIEGTQYYSLAFEALALVNEVRAEKGLSPLVMDSAALEFAMLRAYEIALYCTHNRPDGSGYGYGCATRINGENIAAGCKTAEAAVNGWKNSAGHYWTMVDSDYVSTGIGVFKVGSYYFWVQSFSREDGTTVYASNYSDQSVSAIVNIADYRIEEKINPCLTDSNLKVGETASFEVWFIEQNEKLYPCKYELPAEGMIYTSSNESVVTVNANGVVTAVGEGTATITATYPGYDLEPWAFDITVCNHDSGYTSDVTTEPTCDTDGVRVYTCGDCGDSYTESIDKLGHTWDFGVITEPSTCISTGIRTYTCEVCGDTKTGTIITTVHNYDDGVVTTAATCGASGVKTYTCGTCGATKTEKISPTYNHTYDDGVVGLPATCSTSGTLIHTCTGCGIKMTTYVAATNEHILSDEPTLIREPTCTSYGSKGYFCESCGQMIGSVILIDPVAHAYDEGVAQGKVTCSSVVSMLYTCATCGNTKTSSVYVSHIYDEGVVSTEATCTAKGKTTYTCTLCGKTKKVADIDALGHAEVVDAAVSPTCMETGLTAGSHCERCGLVITAQTTVATTDHSYSSKVVSPTCTTAGYTEYTCASCGDTYQDTPVSSRGHNWDAGTVTTASKCESAGIMTYVCEDCSATKEEVIAATGHSYGKAVTDPSCEEQGYTMYTCAGCGDSYRSDYIDKLGHTMDDGVIQTPATCTEAGSILYSCRECSATTTKEIAATGHSWDDGVVTTVPTCTEEGVKTYTCEHDATHTKTEVIASTGHSYTDTVYAPTCEEGGYTTHTCETCGDSYEDASTSPTGHTWDEGVVTEAATTEDTGVMTYTCTVCGQTKDEDIPRIEETSILRGDVDENGFVDIIDCVRLVRYNAGYDVKINYDAADMTGDGNINTFDVVRLMKYIAGYAV